MNFLVSTPPNVLAPESVSVPVGLLEFTCKDGLDQLSGITKDLCKFDCELVAAQTGSSSCVKKAIFSTLCKSQQCLRKVVSEGWRTILISDGPHRFIIP